jgi:hypothetical protein
MLHCVNLLSSRIPNPDDDGIMLFCNICNYWPTGTVQHFRDFCVHQHHSENSKSCTFQTVIQIIIQFECTGSLSHAVYLIHLIWEIWWQHMWWWCPVRKAFVSYVQGSDLESFIAIDTLTEYADGDYQLLAHCEMGHYLSPWHLSWKTGNNLFYPLFTFCCATVITCS